MVSGVDLATYASTGCAVISVCYAALQRHFPRGEDHDVPSEQVPGHGRRDLLARWLPAALAILAVGFGYYDRHYNSLGSFQKLILSWGISLPFSYYAVVDGSAIQNEAYYFKLLLILRVPYAEKDPMTDTVIEKSELYTIEPQPIVLAHNSEHILKLLLNTATPITFTIGMIPVNISRDDIKSLSDINKVGGRILDQASTAIVAGPPPSPKPPT